MVNHHNKSFSGQFVHIVQGKEVLPENKRENLAAVCGFPGAGSSQQDGQKWPYLLLANLLYLHTKWSIKRVFRIYLKFRGFVTKLLLQHRLTIWHNCAGFGITTAIDKIIISLWQSTRAVLTAVVLHLFKAAVHTYLWCGCRWHTCPSGWNPPGHSHCPSGLSARGYGRCNWGPWCWRQQRESSDSSPLPACFGRRGWRSWKSLGEINKCL